MTTPSSRRGRPAKPLLQHLRDGTFRRHRHIQLLRLEPLPAQPPDWVEPRLEPLWRSLVVAQAAYAAPDDLMTADYRDAFSRGVRALHGGRVPWLLGGPELLRGS